MNANFRRVIFFLGLVGLFVGRVQAQVWKTAHNGSGTFALGAQWSWAIDYDESLESTTHMRIRVSMFAIKDPGQAFQSSLRLPSGTSGYVNAPAGGGSWLVPTSNDPMDGSTTAWSIELGPYIVPLGSSVQWWGNTYGFANGMPTVGWMQVTSWTAANPQIPMQTLPYRVTNTRGVPIKFVLFDKDDNILSSVTVQPGATASVSSPGASPSWPASLGPVTAKVFIQAEFSDGEWVEVATPEDGIEAAVSVSSGVLEYTMPDEPKPTSPVFDVPVPVNGPAAGVTAPEDRPLWQNTQGTDPLTNQVYREGVDKTNAKLDALQASIDGTGLTKTPVLFANSTTSSLFASTNATTEGSWVSGLSSLMPSVPAVFPGNITKTSTFSFILEFPGLPGQYTATADLSPYDTAIQFVRGMLLAFMSIWFFAVLVITVRKAFAS